MASRYRIAQQPARCFGIDAEDGRSAVLVERSGDAVLRAEWYPLDASGVEALAGRVTRNGSRARVCVSSRGARALDVAGRMMRSPQVELLLVFERNRAPCADRFAQAAHAGELARSAQRAL